MHRGTKRQTVMSLEMQATQTGPSCGQCKQATDRILLLEKKCLVSAEHLESEGGVSTSIVDELEQELRIVKRQLKQFQGYQMDEIAERRRAALQYYREEYERQHPERLFLSTGQPFRNQSHTSECEEEDEDEIGDDTVDSGPNMVRRLGCSLSQSVLYDARAAPEDTLHCPKCQTAFPISQHEKLIAHADECI